MTIRSPSNKFPAYARLQVGRCYLFDSIVGSRFLALFRKFSIGMKKLRDLSVDDLDGGINVIDLGASGDVKREWKPLARWMNVFGFDPNEAECARLNAQPSEYHSAKVFSLRPLRVPAASISFTKPRASIVGRCSNRAMTNGFRALFTPNLFVPDGSVTITGYRLDEVRELAGKDIDAMKIDTQGMELPILQAALPFLESSISVETETGFTQNYEGETTFDQILAFMDSHGFGLFGIDANHAVAPEESLERGSRKTNSSFGARPSGCATTTRARPSNLGK